MNSFHCKEIKNRQRNGIEDNYSIGAKSIEEWVHMPRNMVHSVDMRLGTIKLGTLGGFFSTPKEWDKSLDITDYNGTLKIR